MAGRTWVGEHKQKKPTICEEKVKDLAFNFAEIETVSSTAELGLFHEMRSPFVGRGVPPSGWASRYIFFGSAMRERMTEHRGGDEAHALFPGAARRARGHQTNWPSRSAGGINSPDQTRPDHRGHRGHRGRHERAAACGKAWPPAARRWLLSTVHY